MKDLAAEAGHMKSHVFLKLPFFDDAAEDDEVSISICATSAIHLFSMDYFVASWQHEHDSNCGCEEEHDAVDEDDLD